jgi:rSAM/selenodomain-associated transferase 1
MLNDLSIIIPVGPGETAWKELLNDLILMAAHELDPPQQGGRPSDGRPGTFPAQSSLVLPTHCEVLVIGVEAPPAEFDDIKARCLHGDARWLVSRPGRARQMNLGAMVARRRFLWFLHADSRLTPSALASLDRAVRTNPDSIHYFDLAFHDDGPALARVNAWGANLRSRLLRLPFGDQAFCLSTEQFRRLGGFDESLRFGEDHLLIWRAHQNEVAVRPVGTQITSSARKYARDGWLLTTICHLWRTVAQALPQVARLLLKHRSAASKTSQQAEDRLIVFTRCPDPGSCKTRLIPVLGETGAVELHKSLVQLTMSSISAAVDQAVNVEIRYAGDDLQGLRMICGDKADRMRFRPQEGNELGDRLTDALGAAFREGASKVAIIGTDCPELDFTAIATALRLLDDHDLVLGPAVDGGYYLVALRAPIVEIFAGISWGEPTVLTETLRKAQSLGFTTELLPTLADVDRAEDLQLVRATTSG